MSKPKALTVVHVGHRLRAARVSTKHCEGVRGDYIYIKVGDQQVRIDREEFESLAKAILTLPRGPEMDMLRVKL